MLNLTSVTDIIDNTVLKPGQTHRQSESINTRQEKPGPSILRNSEHSKQKATSNMADNFHRNVQIHSPPSSTNESTLTIGSSRSAFSVRTNPIGHISLGYSAANVRPVPIGQAASSSPEFSRKSKASDWSNGKGFNSVRDALMRTSSVIKDIDQLLAKK